MWLFIRDDITILALLLISLFLFNQLVEETYFGFHLVLHFRKRDLFDPFFIGTKPELFHTVRIRALRVYILNKPVAVYQGRLVWSMAPGGIFVESDVTDPPYNNPEPTDYEIARIEAEIKK
jgi:hypothetical protein